MKDEIKEILEYYQKCINRYEKNMKNYTEYQQKTTFSKNYQRYKNHKLLLDYITNLQEVIISLHKELESLYNHLTKKELNYKLRNEKAIKHIKEHCIDDEFYINLTNKEKNIFDVLDILNGDDNE